MERRSDFNVKNGCGNGNEGNCYRCEISCGTKTAWYSPCTYFERGLFDFSNRYNVDRQAAAVGRQYLAAVTLAAQIKGRSRNRALNTTTTGFNYHAGAAKTIFSSIRWDSLLLTFYNLARLRSTV